MLFITIKRDKFKTSYNGQSMILHFHNPLDSLCYVYRLISKYNRIETYIDNQIEDN